MLFVDDFLQIVFSVFDIQTRMKSCLYDWLGLANTPHNQLYYLKFFSALFDCENQNKY